MFCKSIEYYCSIRKYSRTQHFNILYIFSKKNLFNTIYILKLPLYEGEHIPSNNGFWAILEPILNTDSS